MTKACSIKSKLLFNPGFTVNTKAQCAPEQSSYHGISQKMQAFCVIKLLNSWPLQYKQQRREDFSHLVP